MVKSYASRPPFSFEIDGKPYMLPGASNTILKQLDTARRDETDPQAAFDALLVKLSNKRTFDAIDGLGRQEAQELIADWIGGDLGESSSSTE